MKVLQALHGNPTTGSVFHCCRSTRRLWVCRQTARTSRMVRLTASRITTVSEGRRLGHAQSQPLAGSSGPNGCAMCSQSFLLTVAVDEISSFGCAPSIAGPRSVKLCAGHHATGHCSCANRSYSISMYIMPGFRMKLVGIVQEPVGRSLLYVLPEAYHMCLQNDL